MVLGGDYRKASELKIGDRLEPFYQLPSEKGYTIDYFDSIRNHRVVSIEEVGEHEVYDMEVPGLHNFAANGVFVHNSIS